jgi:Tol biopolymer transport system component
VDCSRWQPRKGGIRVQHGRLIVTAASAALAAGLAVVDSARASFPGRNGDVVYADSWGSEVELNTDLYRVCPDGSHERRLLGGIADVGDVAFSPDRRLVAFVWTPYYEGRNRIYIAPGYAQGEDPAWSVCDRIAFVRGDAYEPGAKISVVPARGGDVRELAAGWDAEWSPDGKRLLFATRTPAGATALAVMSADGSRQRVLALGTPAGWAPDGRHVALVTPDGHAAVVAPSGGAVRRLGRTGGSSPVFSPDGKWLALGRLGDLYIARVDGTRTKYVTTAPSLEEDLSVVDWRRLPAAAGCG